MKTPPPFRAALVAIALAWNGIASALTIDFNNYGGPANNDLVNNFYVGKGWAHPTTGGITGGCVIPASPTWQMELKEKFSLPVGGSRSVSLAFRFNAATVSPENFYTGSIAIEGLAAVYIKPSGGIGGNGEFGGTGFAEQGVTLSDAHWYRVTMQVSNIADPFGRGRITSRIDDIGMDGATAPVLLCEGSGEFTDAGFLSDAQLSCYIEANGFGGCAAIDDFTIDLPGEPTPLRSPLILAYRFSETRLDLSSGRAKSRLQGYFLADIENNVGSWFYTQVSRAARTFYRRREPSLIVAPYPLPPSASYLILGTGDVSGTLPNKTARMLYLRGPVSELRLPTRATAVGAKTLAGTLRDIDRSVGLHSRESAFNCRIEKTMTDRIDTAHESITQAENALVADLTARGFSEVPAPN